MSQTVVNSYAYDPFGVILAEDETFSQPFKFVGQYGVMSEPGGLYYMRARYYDSAVGRFISEDPLGFGGGDVNLFAYVKNQPINFIDPLGLSGWAVDAGGAYGTGWGGSSDSSNGLAGTGFYIGATGSTNYAEIGAFTYQGTGVTAGADIGLGYTLTRYKIDAKDFFQGEVFYKKATFLGATFTKYHDACGNEVGWSISIGGRGIGFSKGSGSIQGVQGALQ